MIDSHARMRYTVSEKYKPRLRRHRFGASDGATPAARAVRHGQGVRQRMSANGKKFLPLRKAMKKIYIKYIIVAAAAVGAIVCFILSGQFRGETAEIALIASATGALLIGGAAFAFLANRERAARSGAGKQEERDLLASGKTGAVFLFYIGKRTRIAAPSAGDRFDLTLFLTDDADAVARYLEGTMSGEETARMDETCVRETELCPTVREICAIAGKTVFMYRGEYEAVRSAPAYRALFDNNTVRAIEG